MRRGACVTSLPMRYREIPGTGIRVSELGFGAEPFAIGWWGDDGDDEAVRLLHAALDRGVTLFDAADRDGDGRVQRVLGRAFAGRRDRVVLATRVGYAWEDAEPRRPGRPLPQDFRPDAIRSAVRASADRLGGVIDICELHHPPRRALADDALARVMDELMAEGTVRAFGAAMPSGGRPGDGRRLIRQRRFPVLDVELGVLGHDPGAEIAGLAHAAGSCVIARGAHCRGLLEGKYSRETTFPPGDPRADLSRDWLEEGLRRVATLGFLHADGRPWSLGQAAISWVLSRPGVASVVTPIHSEDHLEEFTRAIDLPALTAEDLARIEALIESGFQPEAEPAPDAAGAAEGGDGEVAAPAGLAQPDHDGGGDAGADEPVAAGASSAE
ncbi:MAG: aldo/keto reductase [Actinobacteria bacterium]|nr:aldo/keto reductase [Actinomycetota bacterium]MBM3697668.1 aldo/keto reductase [Actinomycetota bacterium]